MDKKEKNYDSLAHLVVEIREKLGLSQIGLAKKINLPQNILDDIESGKDLFLSSTIRQKLAKGLKISFEEIKKYEKNFNDEDQSFKSFLIEEIKEKILNGECDILCPKCGSKLNVRIAKLYDLEDQLVFHPKAHCSTCPFQIK